MELVCKGDLSGEKTFCQDTEQGGFEVLPVHDAVKGEIPEGTALGELQFLILKSVSSCSESTVCMCSRAEGVTTKVLLLSVLWTHPKVHLLVLYLASSRVGSHNPCTGILSVCPL